VGCRLQVGQGSGGMVGSLLRGCQSPPPWQWPNAPRRPGNEDAGAEAAILVKTATYNSPRPCMGPVVANHRDLSAGRKALSWRAMAPPCVSNDTTAAKLVERKRTMCDGCLAAVLVEPGRECAWPQTHCEESWRLVAICELCDHVFVRAFCFYSINLAPSVFRSKGAEIDFLKWVLRRT
jgi:hypothetical protein